MRGGAGHTLDAAMDRERRNVGWRQPAPWRYLGESVKSRASPPSRTGLPIAVLVVHIDRIAHLVISSREGTPQLAAEEDGYK